jgi:hypothetical protein
MKKFLLKIFTFSSLIIIVFILGILLPTTPKAKKTMLYSKISKDSLLINTPSPRIIFVGGSNICFGLNSQMISDSLHLNPINTGIHAGFGLIDMLENTLMYVKKGDIVVVSPEYQQFYGNAAYGSEELLRTYFDNTQFLNKKLSWQQWKTIYEFSPKYCFSKFNPKEYFYTKEDSVYGVHSFNKYGDVSAHWSLPNIKYNFYGKITESLNPASIEALVDFGRKIEAKKAKFLFAFPAYETTSYQNSKEEIGDLEAILIRNKIPVISKSTRYIIPDSLTFNTPYHLSKKGTDYKTKLLIQDIKQYSLLIE